MGLLPKCGRTSPLLVLLIGVHFFVTTVEVVRAFEILEPKEVSEYEGKQQNRERRSPNKFESLKRREREQKLIEIGALETDIATDTPGEIRVHTEDTAYLPCRVIHLGTHSVNWEHDGNILSIDSFVITQIPRISIQHDDDTWRLVIRSAQESDSGEYKCLVRSTPPKERTVTLHVLPRGVSLSANSVQDRDIGTW